MSLKNDPGLLESLKLFKLDLAREKRTNAQLLLACPYSITTHWLSQAPELQLTAVFFLFTQGSEAGVLGFVTSDPLPAQRDSSATLDDFIALADVHKSPVFDFAQAIPLHTVHIPKPWGQEIWYTGMENRGVCRVGSNCPGLEHDNNTVPLPWLLSMAPQFIHGNVNISLLKILDPHPDPLAGDLYFELHREKLEVYVVTQIDEAAWPEGEAGIRLGMNQDLRAQYSDDAAFRSAYLTAVQNYRVIREVIDSQPSLKTTDKNRETEQNLREYMQSFTAIKTLRRGDAVIVQPDTPHSLLHGVRVVEFQSPVYERYIISFGQQVLTQATWDSEAAIERMHLDAPANPVFETIEKTAKALVERIASFDEFNVWRVHLKPGGTSRLSAGIPYAICIGLTGQTSIGELSIHAEDACLLPHEACIRAITNNGNTPSICLIAAPGL